MITGDRLRLGNTIHIGGRPSEQVALIEAVAVDQSDTVRRKNIRIELHTVAFIGKIVKRGFLCMA